ncbi:ABC transporter substrate-binding protein [Haloplanus pelagicus]|jgi:NitT/TauT family transport system substrate-binding protein|uniref:ABC transporter substrate-binding protein n=1 Tax=Haloplanus pelagicus TaxID=2949995 RepID=UPI00203D5A22|nr:ABC transporter substrate-binding protein [Haloplanus sp. HW8-1]
MTTFTPSRRRVLGALGAAVTGGAAGCLGGPGDTGGGATAEPTATATPERSSIQVLLDWKANATHAGHFVATSRGFYEAEGLTVDLVSGKGGASTAKQVGLEKYPLGLSSAAATLGTLDEGVPLRAYAAAQQGPNSVVYTTADALGGQLDGPESLAGKTVAVPPAASNLALLKTILTDAGVLGDVSFLEVGWGGLTSSVLSGDANAALGAFPDGISLDREGHDAAMLWIADYIPTVGRSVVASPAFAESNPETLRAYLRATARGWAWASNDPEGAMDLLVAARPRLEASYDLGVTKIEYTAKRLILTDAVREHGWGWQSDDAWQTVVDALVAADFLSEQVAVADAWTNEYLDTADPYVGTYASQVSIDYEL